MNLEQLVSIILPVYNAEKTIYLTIDSILKQSYHNFELIIIDDGSTDTSVKIIQTFNDRRIKLFTFSHQGPAIQRNFGLKQAKGTLIAFCDADDTYLKNKLEKQVRFLSNNKEIKILGSRGNLINGYGKKIGSYNVPLSPMDISYFFPVYCPVITSSILFKKEIIEITGFFDEENEPGTDYKWLLKAQNSGIKIRNLSDKLVNVRITNFSFTTKKRDFLTKKMYYITNSEMEKLYNNKSKDYDYFFRKGLIHYYYGNSFTALKFFFKSISLNPKKLSVNLRYIIPGILGTKNLKRIRNSRFSLLINSFLKLFGIDIAYRK